MFLQGLPTQTVQTSTAREGITLLGRFCVSSKGFTMQQMGYSYGSLSLTYVIGNVFARRLMQQGHTTDQLLNFGYWIFIIGGCCLYLATSIVPHSFLFSILAMSLLTMGNEFLLPLGKSGAVTHIPALAGSASGLMDALQLASAALATQCIGALSQHQPEKFGIVMAVLVISGFVLYRWISAEKFAQK